MNTKQIHLLHIEDDSVDRMVVERVLKKMEVVATVHHASNGEEALDKLMVGRTSFVIAHRLSTIRKADKIIVIDKGEVRESGTHEELMLLNNGMYQSLSRMQTDIV